MSVITIDGPVACGKGTVAKLVARDLGWIHLDSGIFYRLLALFSQEQAIASNDEKALIQAVSLLMFSLENGLVYLNGTDVSQKIRQEEISLRASEVAKLPKVRTALLEMQRAYAKQQNLVAEGRDMGTVVFPKALLKVYLYADPECRAKRRAEQLGIKEDSANYFLILANLIKRDKADRTRELSPLLPAQDAKLLDSTALTAEETAKIILNWYHDLIN